MEEGRIDRGGVGFRCRGSGKARVCDGGPDRRSRRSSDEGTAVGELKRGLVWSHASELGKHGRNARADASTSPRARPGQRSVIQGLGVQTSRRYIHAMGAVQPMQE